MQFFVGLILFTKWKRESELSLRNTEQSESNLYCLNFLNFEFFKLPNYYKIHVSYGLSVGIKVSLYMS